MYWKDTIVTSIEQSLSETPKRKKIFWFIPFLDWSSVGIQTKILAPLVILMLLSLLGSTIGFIISTNTTRNRILDGQLNEDAHRLIGALAQSEQDVMDGAKALSQDPEMIRSLVIDEPGSDVIMRMDSRAVTVRDRFRLDQIVVRNAQDVSRVNITTFSNLSEADFLKHPEISVCKQEAQMRVLHIKATDLLIGCAPIQAPEHVSNPNQNQTIGVVYTVQDLPRSLERFKRELGLASEVAFGLNQNTTNEALRASKPRNSDSGISQNGHRIRNISLNIAGSPSKILVRLSEEHIKKIVGSGFVVMIVSSTITFLLLFSVGVWLARSFVKPIRRLDSVAQAVAAGDLSRRANLFHNDEIGRLGRSFDQATETIAHLLEQQARTAGERHAILQSMADGLLAVDSNERIIMINPVAAELLGQPPSVLLSQPLCALTSVEDPVFATGLQQIVEQVRHDLTEPDAEQNEEHISLGNRVVRLHGAPTRGSGNRLTGAVVVIQDITQAVESDRAKSAFIGTASHELRTPLASMKGFVDIFYMSGVENLSENQRMFLDTIKRQTENMVQLVNDLLEMARLEQGSQVAERQWINLETSVREALTSLQPQIEKRAALLHVSVQPKLPTIWIDSMHLRRIVTNLLSNAVKYVRMNGFIVVRVYELETIDQLPSHPVDQPWKYQAQRSVVFEVEDNGVGIRAEDQDKIFTRFFRSDNELSVESGGTGLGLAITQSLVHLHYGQIGFRSIENEGSCFWVRFPAPSTDILQDNKEVEETTLTA